LQPRCDTDRPGTLLLTRIAEYDRPQLYRIADPSDRYSIGGRTPGFVYAGDGSLTIVMQHSQPADDHDRANRPPGHFARSSGGGGKRPVRHATVSECADRKTRRGSCQLFQRYGR